MHTFNNQVIVIISKMKVSAIMHNSSAKSHILARKTIYLKWIEPIRNFDGK